MGKNILDEGVWALLKQFRFVSDPRVAKRSKYKLIDIIVVSICAILSGAQTCTDIEEFGVAREEWLKNFLDLSNGIPSHDTFARVLSLVNPREMEEAFQEWVKVITEELKIRSISIDGKSVAQTGDFRNRPLHLVNVYAHEQGLALSQSLAKGSGVGETEGALHCLQQLDIKGVLVLVDAGLSTHRIASQIRDQKGDYLVPIKGNQRHSLKQIETKFRIETKTKKSASTKDKHHGRLEERHCEVLKASEFTDSFYNQWPGVKSVARITRVRELPNKGTVVKNKTSDGTHRYEKDTAEFKITKRVIHYVCSRNLTAQQALHESRKHWGIENKLHWILDVAFGEDDWPVRQKTLSRNLSVIRKIAYNIIKNSKTEGSVKSRIKRAGWNEKFLEKLIFDA